MKILKELIFISGIALYFVFLYFILGQNIKYKTLILIAFIIFQIFSIIIAIKKYIGIKNPSYLEDRVLYGGVGLHIIGIFLETLEIFKYNE